MERYLQYTYKEKNYKKNYDNENVYQLESPTNSVNLKKNNIIYSSSISILVLSLLSSISMSAFLLVFSFRILLP